MPMMPHQIEESLVRLDKALDEAQEALEGAESEYQSAKSSFELAMAHTRLELLDRGGKKTVQERDDMALVANEYAYRSMMEAEAWVKAARANVSRLRTKVDIIRSMSANLRSAMDL